MPSRLARPSSSTRSSIRRAIPERYRRPAIRQTCLPFPREDVTRQKGEGTISSAGADFPARFEAALARLRFAAECGWAEGGSEPERVAAALRAVFEFASRNPAAFHLLTSGALADGRYGTARHRELLTAAARVLAGCRDADAGGAELPAVTERALVGGIATLLSERFDADREAELTALAPEAIEFALTPYVGAAEARRIAAL